jgi:uncharacterized protein (TIGR03083 family)
MTLAEAQVQGFEVVKRHTARFAAYVTGLGAGDIARQVPGSGWTVGQTITHVQSVFLRYTTDLRRARTPAEVAIQNAEDITRLGIDVAAAVQAMTGQLTVMEAVIPHVRPDQRFPFHAGQDITMAGGWGNLTGELLAHGDDIARATGVPFAIPSADTEVLWRFAAPALQGWLRPEAAELNDTWLLRFPFGPIGVAFDHGRLRWGDDAVAHPDYTIDISDAARFALAFPYRRRPAPSPDVARLARRFHEV